MSVMWRHKWYVNKNSLQAIGQTHKKTMNNNICISQDGSSAGRSAAHGELIGGGVGRVPKLYSIILCDEKVHTASLTTLLMVYCEYPKSSLHISSGKVSDCDDNFNLGSEGILDIRLEKSISHCQSQRELPPSLNDIFSPVQSQ